MTPVPVTPVTPFHLTLWHAMVKYLDTPIVWIFLIAILLDIATGYYRSFITPETIHKTSSAKGWQGLLKHCIVILINLILYPTLCALGFSAVGTTLVVYYIITYAVSILENCAQANIPVPSFIREHLAKLQSDYDQNNNNKWKL